MMAQPAWCPPSSPGGCVLCLGPAIHHAALTLKFQMHTNSKTLLKMLCFVLFFFSNMFLPLPPLCLKDELSVTFSQSFLLINLGKVNGSVHAPLGPLCISLSHGISAWQGSRSVWRLAIVKCVTHTPHARELMNFLKSSPIVPRSPLSLPPSPPCVLSQGRHE